MQILREERQLVYDASAADSFNIGIDGGFLCVEAETANQKNIEKVTKGIFDVLADSQTTSGYWYQFVTDQIIGSTAMLTIDPSKMTASMLDEISFGADHFFTSTEEASKALAEISHSDYLEMLSNFSRENAKIIIFKGIEK